VLPLPLAGRTLTSKLQHRRKAKEKGRGWGPLLFLIPIVMVIVVAGYLASRPPEHTSIGVGDVAPDFELQAVGPDGLTGQTASLSSFRGRVVLLEFMVSWCPNCRAMAPQVEALRENYEPKGVVFISVAGTFQGADENSTAAFIRDYGAQWTHVLDLDNSVFSKYHVQGTPTYFIIDRDGKIVKTYQGITSPAYLSSALDAALGS
jgi:thiol-disulfide isomerase/thioredoxin